MGTKITPAVASLVDALKADLKVAKANGYSLQAVAEEMGRSYSWAAEMVRGKQPFPLIKMDAWVELTGAHNLAHWVAARAGYDLVPHEDDELESSLIRAVKESSDATQKASEAILDGVITEDEVLAYEKEMEEAIETFRRLDRALQASRERRARGPVSLTEAEARRRKLWP